MANQLSNLSDNLNELVNKNVQKMQQRQMLKQALFNPQQGSNTTNDLLNGGLGGHSLSTSLNASDLLQRMGQPQNLIEKAAGRTPVNLPSIFGNQEPQPMMQQQQPQQEPMTMQAARVTAQPEIRKEPIPENESLIDKKERLLRERNEIKEKNAREKEERVAKREREKEERAEKTKRQLHIDKETLPFYKKMKDMAMAIPEVDARLDQMSDLLDTGKVQWFGFLDSLSHTPYIGPFAGAIEQAMTTTESQNFKKLSNDFLRDAKPYFGSNMSTEEVKLFLQRVPSLMLSNEGNRALIRNFRAMNEYAKEVDKILEGIIAENGGERPKDLQAKLQSRIGQPANKLRKSFRESVKLIPQKDVKTLEDIEDRKDSNESYGTKRFLKNATKLISA